MSSSTLQTVCGTSTVLWLFELRTQMEQPMKLCTMVWCSQYEDHLKKLNYCMAKIQDGPIKTAHFLRYHIFAATTDNHTVCAEVFRNYSRQATIFFKQVLNILCKLVKTRGAWQSQTWGRPAPQVRVQNQFKPYVVEISLAAMAVGLQRSGDCKNFRAQHPLRAEM